MTKDMTTSTWDELLWNACHETEAIWDDNSAHTVAYRCEQSMRWQIAFVD